MGLEVIVRSQQFQANNATGNQTITLSPGVGLTPKAAIFVMSADQTLESLSTAGSRMSIGMTDGTNHRAVGATNEDGVAAANADTGVRADVDTVIQMPNNADETLQTEAAFVSFGTDAVTISWSAAFQGQGYVVFFFGADITAKVISFTSSALLNGTQPSGSLGFAPELLFFGSVNMAFAADGSQGEEMLSFGYAGKNSSTTQCCICNCVEDRQSPSSVGGVIRDNRVATTLTSAAGVITEGASLEVTTFASDSFTCTTRDTGATVECMVLALNIGGVRTHCGVPVIAAGTVGDKAVTAPGFIPQFAMFGAFRSGTANSVSSAQGQQCIGAGKPSAQASTAFAFNDNNAGTSAGQMHCSAVNVIDYPVNDTTIDWAAALTTFDATGYTLNVSDTSEGGGNRILAALTIEQPPKVIAANTEQISDTVVRLVTIDRRVAGDTEQISEAVVRLVTIDRRALSETEQISDAAVLAVTINRRVIAEVEQISDGFAVTRKEALGETEQINDAAVLVSGRMKDYADTEQIVDAVVSVLTAAANNIIAAETEEISDAAVLARFDAIKVYSDTERISDQALLYLGRKMVVNDIVDILEQFNSGAGLRAMKLKKAGRVFQW